ncbi:hypothetical protein BD779DRAFT_611747 [Infundibulicybe gibba]|nr:hypothetical protein BD779DRAFT_611747 [Infundibulicybe gibba]
MANDLSPPLVLAEAQDILPSPANKAHTPVNEHNVIMDGRTQCTFCGREMAVTSVWRHQRACVQNANRVVNHICGCGRSFLRPDALRGHQKRAGCLPPTPAC